MLLWLAILPYSLLTIGWGVVPVISLAALLLHMRLFNFFCAFEFTSRMVTIVNRAALFDLPGFVSALFVFIPGFGLAFYILDQKSYDGESEIFPAGVPDTWLVLFRVMLGEKPAWSKSCIDEASQTCSAGTANTSYHR